MREDDHYAVRSRERKRRSADKILNISIGIVLLLILLVGGQFLLGGKDSEPTSKDIESAVEEDNQLNGNVTEEQPSENGDGNVSEVEESKQDEVTNGKKDSSGTGEQALDQNNNSSQEPQTGEWQPIGTVQEEPFTAVYDKDHVNWEEMRKALQYATGLGDDMTIWYIGNGGNHQSAVGTVSDYSTRTTPFEVRIEWVTNEGWMPVSVKQLDENQFLSQYISTDEQETDQSSNN